MHTMLLHPEYDMPRADSMAVFSFELQEQWIPFSRETGECWIYSVISVLGVPG